MRRRGRVAHAGLLVAPSSSYGSCPRSLGETQAPSRQLVFPPFCTANPSSDSVTIGFLVDCPPPNEDCNPHRSTTITRPPCTSRTFAPALRDLLRRHCGTARCRADSGKGNTAAFRLAAAMQDRSARAAEPEQSGPHRSLRTLRCWPQS